MPGRSSSETDGKPRGRASRGNHDLARYLSLTLLAVLVVVAIFLVGRHARSDIRALDSWVEEHAVLGPLVYVATVVVLTSVFVPDTILAVGAGVAFGLAWGTAIITVGALLTATVNFFLSRWFLRSQIDRMLKSRPKLAAIKAAVSRQGLRLLVLLRLTPINPVAVSYVMGTTRLRYAPFLVGSLPMIPALFVEVYFGYVARHVAAVAAAPAKHSPQHTIVSIVGLAACLAVLIYTTRLARRALAECDESLGPPEDDEAAKR